MRRDDPISSAAPLQHERSQENLRHLLSQKAPRHWFVPQDAYGWGITARILGTLFALFCAPPLLAAYTGGASETWIFIAAVPLLGIATYKMQFVLHDACHFSLFRSRQTNTRVGTWVGYLSGVHFGRYRHIHFRHHARNGMMDDPQLGDYLGDKPVGRFRYLAFVASPLVGGRVWNYLSRELGLNRISNPNADPGAPRIDAKWILSTISIQVAVAAITSGFGRHPLFALAYPCGAVFVALFLARIRAIAEHYQKYEERTVDFTRSHRPNLLDWFFLYDAHFNYHLEHHIFPEMPSVNLPALHSELGHQFHTGETLGRSMFGTAIESLRKLPAR